MGCREIMLCFQGLDKFTTRLQLPYCFTPIISQRGKRWRKRLLYSWCNNIDLSHRGRGLICLDVHYQTINIGLKLQYKQYKWIMWVYFTPQTQSATVSLALPLYMSLLSLSWWYEIINSEVKHFAFFSQAEHLIDLHLKKVNKKKKCYLTAEEPFKKLTYAAEGPLHRFTHYLKMNSPSKLYTFCRRNVVTNKLTAVCVYMSLYEDVFS